VAGHPQLRTNPMDRTFSQNYPGATARTLRSQSATMMAFGDTIFDSDGTDQSSGPLHRLAAESGGYLRQPDDLRLPLAPRDFCRCVDYEPRGYVLLRLAGRGGHQDQQVPRRVYVWGWQPDEVR